MSSTARLIPRFRALVTFLLAAATATAQTAATPSTSTSTSNSEAPIELSPFVVDDSRDVGYVANNTLAGSRLNTSLKDTAASISVMTEEFLSDIGAFSVEEAMAYASNLQVDQEDTVESINGNLIVENFANYRIRGMKASTARNYFIWNVPGSTYNVERIDESRGPNSILFGLGSAGGIINTSTKQARLRQARRAVSLTVGSFDSYRTTIDVNQPLVKDRLAVRMNGQWSKQHTSRDFSEALDQRIHFTTLYQPFRDTRIRAEFERGQINDHVTRPWTARDMFTLWDARGRPTRTDVTAVAADGIARLNANQPRLTVIENNDSFVDMRGMLSTTVASDRQNTMIMDQSLVDFSVNPAGPGATRDSRFTNYTANIEQKLPANTFIALAYNHQYYDFVNYDPDQASANTLFGDPNRNLPVVNGVAQPNPFAGQGYFETNWFRRWRNEEFDTLRLTVSNEFSLGKWGKYRWAAMAEEERSEYRRAIGTEAWEGRPFNVNPESVPNRVWRRAYITEGQWSTYRVPSARDAMVTNRVNPVNGQPLTSTWVQMNANIDDDSQKLRTLLLGGQASWFENRLIGTFGVRRDELDITNPLTTRDPATNEWIVDYANVDRFSESGVTRTFGGVWHITPQISLAYNKSTNSALSNSAHRVLPESSKAEQGKGEGEDYGLNFDLLDGRIDARITYYTTSGRRETDFRGVQNFATQRNDRVLDALVAAGVISAADSQARRINVNGAYSDRDAEGWEFRVVANPSKNWRLQASYSITDAVQSNIMPEIVAWAAESIAYWRQFDTSIPTSNRPSIAQEIEELEDGIDAQVAADGRGAIGNRKYKASIFTRYDFSLPRLKGAYIGGGWRYQSQMLIGRNTGTGELRYSPSKIFTDALAGYRFRLPNKRMSASVQLNISNLLDDQEPTILRYTPDFQYIRNFAITEPRTYRLSLNFEF